MNEMDEIKDLFNAIAEAQRKQEEQTEEEGMKQIAVEFHKLYSNFIEAGFERADALTLVSNILSASVTQILTGELES